MCLHKTRVKMANKSSIQKILDNYLNFAKNSETNNSKKQGFWQDTNLENKNEPQVIKDAQGINDIFSIIEEIDNSVGQNIDIQELNKKIDSYESAALPVQEKAIWKEIYFKAAAILLPFAIIISSLYFFTSKDNSTKYQIVSTEKGSKTKLVLEDGTTVWLNAESELKYPSTFKNQDKRVITLTGEAYFDVARNEKQPFEVYAGGYKFKVLGTAFNIKAYPKENKIETTLEHGKVNVEKLVDDGTEKARQVVSLEPKQTIVLYKNALQEEELKNEQIGQIEEDKSGDDNLEDKSAELIENEDLSTYLAWKDNMMVFQDVAISEMLNDLERRYSINIEVTNKKIKDIKFTGTFTVETPEQAIKILCIAAKIDYEIKKDKVLLKSK